MNTLDRFRRKLFYLRCNVRDIVDSYLAPPLSPQMTPFGFSFLGGNSQHHKAMQKGTFETIEVEWLKSMLPRVDALVDVGANVGYFSCLARQFGKPVIAVEPLPSNLQLLLQNLKLNEGPAVEVFPVGLAEKLGVGTLYGASSTGASLIDNWAGAPSSISRLIPLTTLDNVLAGRFVDQRMIIKVDVEGAEFQVLRGAPKTLLRNVKPVWLVEIALTEYHPMGINADFQATFELFWSHGYASSVLTPGGLVSIGREDVTRYVRAGRTDHPDINYVFAPTDFA